ncbi:molybdenum cofactor guanylyltransferase MobA [Gulbenkiania mobilis]|uniref:molybdenum cofactor guanylyltransferase MobA n=1 Tax=Gulbenkiania mobilis TaxID=397457 RepID=UPI0006BBB04C|nr:molybdenum cofactor guanylyltransferase MobA [Gulbenkiania mobilis]
MTTTEYTALILAGGEGRRMGGVDKGWVMLEGRPLVQHVLAALSTQSHPPSGILISANRTLEAYRALGHPVLCDAGRDAIGPLAGLERGLAKAAGRPLLMVPCDAVSLPPDLATRLLAPLSEGWDVASAEDTQGWQPAFLAVRPGLHASLVRYLENGGRSIRGWLEGLRHCRVAVSPPLPNLNTPEALAAHERARQASDQSP